jgi:hypothetical protein
MKTIRIRAVFICILAACATEPDDNPELATAESALTNNQHTAFNYFVSKGLTAAQAAGVVGNLIQESNVVPTATQSGGGKGRGIAQWSVGGRWDTGTDSVVRYVSVHGGNRWSLSTQLDFIWWELQTYSFYGYASLKAATNVTDATIAFQNRYEMCGSTCRQSTRIAYAKAVFAAWGNGSSGTCYSGTLGQHMPHNACVESKFDGLWYQCSDGFWGDRWSNPEPCNGVYPL